MTQLGTRTACLAVFDGFDSHIGRKVEGRLFGLSNGTADLGLVGSIPTSPTK